MKRSKAANTRKKDGFLLVSFSVSKDAHPQVYDFFFDHLAPILQKLGQTQCSIVLERLEPLNTVYSHLDFSEKIVKRIFLRYCRAHRLQAYAAFSAKQKISCKGKVRTEKLGEALDDYNRLFDLFFCDIQIRGTKLFIDAMDLFSNQVLVQGNPKSLAQFQNLLKRQLPKTRFQTA